MHGIEHDAHLCNQTCMHYNTFKMPSHTFLFEMFTSNHVIFHLTCCIKFYCSALRACHCRVASTSHKQFNSYHNVGASLNTIWFGLRTVNSQTKLYDEKPRYDYMNQYCCAMWEQRARASALIRIVKCKM